MSIEANKKIVARYFAEALDAGNVAILDELFTADCVIHRPEAAAPLRGLDAIRRIVQGRCDRYSAFKSVIHEMIGEGDKVVCRLTHSVVYKGPWRSRIGVHEIPGVAVQWSPVAIFAIRGGKIAEEWVCRDELGMLIQAGVITPAR